MDEVLTSDSVCGICGAAKSAQARWCRRCRQLIDKGKGKNFTAEAVESALKKAWDGSGFRCYWSGALVDVTDGACPRYLCFDHRTPRDSGDCVVSTFLMNDMKTDMSEDEFRRTVVELAERFKTGHEVPSGVFALQHWKRC